MIDENKVGIRTGPEAFAPADGRGRKVLYGLPCANCRSYYDSNLAICPICQCGERVVIKTTFSPSVAAF